MCNKLGPDVFREGWPGSIEEGRDDTSVGGDDVAAEGVRSAVRKARKAVKLSESIGMQCTFRVSSLCCFNI